MTSIIENINNNDGNQILRQCLSNFSWNFQTISRFVIVFISEKILNFYETGPEPQPKLNYVPITKKRPASEKTKVFQLHGLSKPRWEILQQRQ